MSFQASPASNDLCELLPWDTDFFGFTIARARVDALTPQTVKQIDDWCRKGHVRCLYFAARPNDPQTIELAETRGYHRVDERMTLGRELAGVSTVLPASIRPARAPDLPALQRIAGVAHRDTRFFFDRHFSQDQARALYEEWIRVSFHGFAQAVFVSDAGEGPQGYVACHVAPNKSTGSIGLIAVDASAQGRGVGRALVEAAMAWLNSQGVPHVTVVTQGRNLVAQRLYERCGFIAERLQLYYHLWFDPSEDHEVTA
jgi:dTDP-4-amino-4,6-dideoxy-D-galactose acyltransferase